jgi:hypothetical protein
MDFLCSRLHKTFGKSGRERGRHPNPAKEMIANAAVRDAVFKSVWSGNAQLAPM